jgi:hypothetical protein
MVHWWGFVYKVMNHEPQGCLKVRDFLMSYELSAFLKTTLLKNYFVIAIVYGWPHFILIGILIHIYLYIHLFHVLELPQI